MKKILILAMIMALILTGCHPDKPESSSPEAPPESQSEAPPESQSGESDVLTQLPETTAELQEVTDKYLAIAGPTLLAKQFTREDYSDFGSWPDLAMTAEDFYWGQSQAEDSYVEYWSHGTDGFPAEFFEGILQEHLPIPSETIQAAFGDQYHADTQTYHYDDGRGGPGVRVPLATSVSQQGDILTIGYDLYVAMPSDEPPYDYAQYTLYSSGEVTVELQGENYIYLSNTSAPAVG